MMKRNEGFTLIELLVTISIGTLVTFAAISLLLLGVRVQYNTTQESKDQQTVRVAMSLLENMAGSGDFNAIETTYNGWKLLNVTVDAGGNENKEPVFEYVNTDQTIYRGAQTDGEAILSGLNNASVTMEGNMLRLSFETDRGANYVTRVYCRTAEVKEETAEDVKDAQEHSQTGQQKIPEEGNSDSRNNRINFLNRLAAEYGSGQNTGMSSTGEYYSHWYIGDEGWGQNGWNKDTPWCACFVSWAADQIGITGFKFANVDSGMNAFKDADRWYKANERTPIPGDYIFFDWSGEQKDPAHVGVVLDVAAEADGTYVYTIEGNSSGRVAVRKYGIGNSDIMGYGVLPGF